MADVKKERPRMFDDVDKFLEVVKPNQIQREDDTGVENFKKWFKDKK